MKHVAMVLALLIGMPVPASAAASLSSLSRSPAPEAIPPRVTTPGPIKLVPIPPRPTEPPPSTDVPLPPQPVAPPPSEAPVPVVVGPVAPLPTAEPPTVEPPATTEPTPTVIAEPTTPQPAPLSRPLVVGRPPEPLQILDPPPPPGTGMRVGGGILIGLGTLNTIIGGLFMAAGDKEERAFGIARLALGVVELGSGVALVAYGVRRTKRLDAWKLESSQAVPKTGNGMLVGGSILLGVGLYDGLTAAVLGQQTGEVPVGTVAVAAMEVVAGALLLVVGQRRKRRYQRWEHDSFAFAGPSVTSLPGGGALAMRGRF